MILVADSGSTKTNWLADGHPIMETIGFNPFFHSSEDIYSELERSAALGAIRDQITKIFFYGAGCSSPERNLIVQVSLHKFFGDAHIEVDHDLKAAALATYDGRACISCILGTGSNSCVFDGKDIDNSVPALGYILGDEASGSYFGRKLLASYLYHELPEATKHLMDTQYDLSKEKIFWAVYNESHANVYMARFAKVLTQSHDKEYIEAMVADGFRDFFKHHVVCFDGYQSMPVHFVGSIAFYFKDLLKAVATEYGCELGVVDKQPVYRLLDWHSSDKNV